MLKLQSAELLPEPEPVWPLTQTSSVLVSLPSKPETTRWTLNCDQNFPLTQKCDCQQFSLNTQQSETICQNVTKMWLRLWLRSSETQTSERIFSDRPASTESAQTNEEFSCQYCQYWAKLEITFGHITLLWSHLSFWQLQFYITPWGCHTPIFTLM